MSTNKSFQSCEKNNECKSQKKVISTTCKCCNKELKNVHFNTKYCPECFKKLQKNFVKQWREKQKLKKTKNISKNNLSECVKQANKLGMSYGQYMALKNKGAV